MHPFTQHLIEAFAAKADPERAAKQKAYFLGKFEFHGLSAPIMKATVKEVAKENGMPDIADLSEIVQELWALPQREFQNAAIELMVKMKRHLPESFINLVEDLVATKSWWETVDGLSIWIMGPLLLKYDGQAYARSRKWLDSGNMWQQRCAIIFQNGYKEKVDLELLFANCWEMARSDEWFIQKAIGWALRTAGERFPEEVVTFCGNTPLSDFSRKEALRKIIAGKK